MGLEDLPQFAKYGVGAPPVLAPERRSAPPLSSILVPRPNVFRDLRPRLVPPLRNRPESALEPQRNNCYKCYIDLRSRARDCRMARARALSRSISALSASSEVELELVADALDELDLHLAPIEVAVEIEEMNLEQGRAVIDRRAACRSWRPPERRARRPAPRPRKFRARAGWSARARYSRSARRACVPGADPKSPGLKPNSCARGPSPPRRGRRCSSALRTALEETTPAPSSTLATISTPKPCRAPASARVAGEPDRPLPK